MTSNIPDSPASPETPTQRVLPWRSRQSTSSTSFEDRFQQLFCVEISPKLWLTVQRAKSSNGQTYVDIRRRMERVINGVKTQIPTKLGLFLRYNEFESLKEKLNNTNEGNREFELNLNGGREISCNGQQIGAVEIRLKAGAKETCIRLEKDEIFKVATHSIPDQVFAAMQEIIWE